MWPLKEKHAMQVWVRLWAQGCGADSMPSIPMCTWCYFLVYKHGFSDTCWSHMYILRDPSFLFSFQQKQVLCHLPLPLHEWPIAPWPHVQLVKVWGGFAFKRDQLCEITLHIRPILEMQIFHNMNHLALSFSCWTCFLLVCCWLSVSERKEMPLPIWASLHRNANQG